MQTADDPDEACEADAPYYGALRGHVVIIDEESQVVGSGVSLAKALQDAEDYEATKRFPTRKRCPHCHRYADERGLTGGWLAYPITVDAWGLLTCGGPFEDALTDYDDYSWCEGTRAIVYLHDASCIACRGKGTLPRRQEKPGSPLRDCPVCDGKGYIPKEGLMPLLPPDDAAIWRTGDPRV